MTQEQPVAQTDENQIIGERRAKLARMREAGIAFPNDFRREHMAAELQQRFSDHDKDMLEALAPGARSVRIAGRMLLKRVMGKASFATIQDGSGRIQLFVSDDGVGTDAHQQFKHFDLGDILGAVGELFRTRTGELSVRVSSLRLLTKALRPLPEKFHGLSDQEQKYRQRYVDLIVNEDSRRIFLLRSRIIQAVRQFMLQADYLEVETPMMHPIPGGAVARPFVTHHNALDMQLYLRIAPELYLKRLVVGGLERVFEINRNFRNEGISTRHNPEFTMMEFYEAYRDYRYLMDFTERLFRHVCATVLGTLTVSYGGRALDFSKPFDRLTTIDAICCYNPDITRAQLHDREWITGALRRDGIAVKSNEGMGSLQLKLFEQTTEGRLFDPTFIVDYPAEVSPLARRSDTQPDLTERFELFITGREIANGFSELNDAEDQAERFREQARHKDAGDHEAMHYDADYIRALEHGLPPTAGEGLGIDRIVMLLADAPSIRDVILFPQLRNEDITT